MLAVMFRIGSVPLSFINQPRNYDADLMLASSRKHSNSEPWLLNRWTRRNCKSRERKKLAKQPFPSELKDRFIVRLPEGIRDRVREAAEQSGRSMNAEFVFRIEASFHTPDTAALREAVLVAESLRKNLSEKMANMDAAREALAEQAKSYDELLASRYATLDEMEQRLLEREKAFDDEMRARRLELEAEIDERRRRLEKRFHEDLQSLAQRRQQADEYAGFTIAREQQFIDTIKALTGKEPAPVISPPPRRLSKK